MAVTARPMADARGFERTMAMRRDAQYATDGLHKFTAQNSRSAAINESDARVEAMRRMRNLQTQNAEVRHPTHAQNCRHHSCLSCACTSQ
jgi:hypothetical protein